MNRSQPFVPLESADALKNNADLFLFIKPCSQLACFLALVVLLCDGYMGEVMGECYGNSDQGQWDVALEALMALFSVDLNITQQRIYNLHLIHELWNGDGTVPF